MSLKVNLIQRIDIPKSEVPESEESYFCTKYPPMDAKEVQNLRMAYGLSQELFAKNFGVSVSTLRKWEQGVNSPSSAVSTLLQINIHQRQLSEMEVV